MIGAGAAEEKPPRRHEPSLFMIVLLACTLMTVVQFFGCVQQGECIAAEDFDVFYGPAQAMRLHPEVSPYPVAQAKAWVDGTGPNNVFHYSLYPPYSLLLFYPLGFLTSEAALTVWLGLQVVILGACCFSPYIKRLARAPGSHDITALGMLLPFMALSLLAGQVGTLCAALFACGMAWRNTRPVLAGIALALLALKPQLALMLPVLLLYERNFTVLLAAGALLALLAGMSVLMLGAQVWQDYYRMLALSPQILDIAVPQLLKVSLSPALALRMAGVVAPVCLAVQSIFSLAVLGFTWRALAKADENAKLLLIATATFLVSPYSFHYDAVVLALPCIMLMRRWKEHSITALQRTALIVMAFIPIVAIKLQAMHIPYGFAAIMTGFCVAQAHAAAKG